VFKHVLVPLDGSRLAEAALPVAAYLAGRMRASITLIHIIERNAPAEVHSDRHLTDVQEATDYLNQTAQRAIPGETPVETHVHTAEVSDVPRSIVDHAGELGQDLIVMCAHGRSGARDWLFGSIAQQVIAMGTIPVLLVRPTGESEAQAFTCKTILVPLDGVPEHEEALPMAAELARVCEARLHLFMAIPTLATLAGREAAAAMLLPGATRAMLDMDMTGGEGYLQRCCERLAETGLAPTREVGRGDPAPSIVEAAERIQASMIVLGTHGTVGSQAFWERSVPPKVSSRTTIPILLVPVGREGTTRY
jgi:nucleotide-binding universal stress UspA family protein